LLEGSISKFQTRAAANQTRDKLSALAADISSNRQRIATMRTMIEQMRPETPAIAPAAPVTEAVAVAKPQAVPDVRKAVQEVSGDAERFQTSFDREVEALQQKVGVFERQIAALAAIRVEVSEAARSFECRVRRLDQNTQKMVVQMLDVAGRLEDGTDQQLLRALAAKLQKVYEDLKSEMDALRGGMQKLEASTAAPTDDRLCS
jgi:septal ring factor EnvC (AmiA/AmiB activator)